MPFFNRKPQAADANTATSVGGNNAPTTEKTGLKGLLYRRTRAPAQERAAYDNENLNARPRFGQWLKGTIFDIITMVIMGIIGLGVSCASQRSSSGSLLIILGLLRSTCSISLVPGGISQWQCRLSRIRLPSSQGDRTNLGGGLASLTSPHRLHPDHANPHTLILGHQQRHLRPSLLPDHRRRLPGHAQMPHWRSTPAFPRGLQS